MFVHSSIFMSFSANIFSIFPVIRTKFHFCPFARDKKPSGREAVLSLFST